MRDDCTCMHGIRRTQRELCRQAGGRLDCLQGRVAPVSDVLQLRASWVLHTSLVNRSGQCTQLRLFPIEMRVIPRDLAAGAEHFFVALQPFLVECHVHSIPSLLGGRLVLLPKPCSNRLETRVTFRREGFKRGSWRSARRGSGTVPYVNTSINCRPRFAAASFAAIAFSASASTLLSATVFSISSAFASRIT